MKLKKIILFILVASLLAAPIQASAAGTELISAEDAAAFLLENRQENVLIQQPNEGTGIKLPERYDLRELGYVTPVKDQSPYGTCWGFASIAAAETSILSEMGKTYEETGLDLSEHHLTYFSRVPIVDETQDGEGWHLTGGSLFDTGGMMFMASSVFSTGIGVVTEDLVPYRGRNSNTDSYYGINIGYSADDDWSLPEEYRLLQSYELEESSLLPAPAVYLPGTGSDSFERLNNYLGYDATATENIKKELLLGRAVTIAFCADTSLPGEDGTCNYMNENTWAHYTFNGASMNHAVTIVGYDDSFPATNFIDHSNDPYGDGLPHQPEGNGAWIVKNSWGAQTEKFPNFGSWGMENDEGKNTGYFWLSYYDRSICMPESFDFNVTNLEGSYIIEQYDYLPSGDAEGWMNTNQLRMANIFTAEADAFIRNLSCETSAENTVVRYEVYLLDADDTVPTDGKLAASELAEHRYPGYHRIELSTPVKVSEGQRYAVVVTLTTDVGDEVYYSLSTNCAFNKAGMDALNYTIYMDCSDASEEELDSIMEHLYAVGIVNPGESLVYIDALGGWADWAEIVPELQKTMEFKYVDFDNFPVKAYLDFDGESELMNSELPELKFAPPVKQLGTLFYVLVCCALLLAILLLIVLPAVLICRAVKLHRHPELRKPKKPRKPSYKALKAQLEEANARIRELEQKEE